jgi:hypothetical protein
LPEVGPWECCVTIRKRNAQHVLAIRRVTPARAPRSCCPVVLGSPLMGGLRFRGNGRRRTLV